MKVVGAGARLGEQGRRYTPRGGAKMLRFGEELRVGV
jgi:hypothetical protein